MITKYSLLGLAKYPESADSDRLKEEYENGNGAALAIAILFYGKRGEALRPWIVSAWQQACYGVDDLTLSWNKILGAKTEGQRDRERERSQKKWLIVYRVERGDYKDLQISREGVGSDLFSKMAEDLTADGQRGGVWEQVTWREAKELYYEIPAERRTKP